MKRTSSWQIMKEFDCLASLGLQICSMYVFLYITTYIDNFTMPTNRDNTNGARLTGLPARKALSSSRNPQQNRSEFCVRHWWLHLVFNQHMYCINIVVKTTCYLEMYFVLFGYKTTTKSILQKWNSRDITCHNINVLKASPAFPLKSSYELLSLHNTPQLISWCSNQILQTDYCYG